MKTCSIFFRTNLRQVFWVNRSHMQHTSSTALETDTTNESLEVTSACEDQLWELLTSLSPRILWLHFGSLPARFRYFLPRWSRRKSSEKLPVDPGWMGSTLILQKEATAPPPPLKVVTGNSGNTTRHMVTGCDAYAIPQYVVQVPLNFPSLQTILKAMSEIVSVEILVLCELKAMFITTQQGMKYEIFMNQLVKHGLTQGYCIEHS